jgi:hypothetical protein
MILAPQKTAIILLQKIDETQYVYCEAGTTMLNAPRSVEAKRDLQLVIKFLLIFSNYYSSILMLGVSKQNKHAARSLLHAVSD